jgi:hypothetical protein
VFAIADSVSAIFQNHGIRVRGGIGFSVNKRRRITVDVVDANFALTGTRSHTHSVNSCTTVRLAV